MLHDSDMKPNYLHRAYTEYDRISIREKIKAQKRNRCVINCCIDKKQRLQDIEAAFKNIRPPFLKACPNDYHDPTADAGYVARRSNVHWRKFPTYILTREFWSLFALTREGFMYILPAYLSYYVQNDFNDGIMLVFMEELARRCEVQELSLSEEQAQVMEKVMLKPFESYVLRYARSPDVVNGLTDDGNEWIEQLQIIRNHTKVKSQEQINSEIWYIEPDLPYRISKHYHMRCLRYQKKRMASDS